MLETLGVVLMVGWFLGMLPSYTVEGFLHFFGIGVFVVILIYFSQSRRD